LTLNSDNHPITLALPSDQLPPSTRPKTYTNFKKADWPRFIREVEQCLRSCPLPTCSEGEKVFRGALVNASKHSIPAWFVKDCVSGLSREVSEKIEKLDLRRANPQDPEISKLNKGIASEITENHRRIWRKTVESADSGTDHKKLWRVVGFLKAKW
jgi:hypothetical protein